MERLKSFVLAALIVSSLVMSGLLWYRPPNVDELSRDDYIPQQLIGETRQVEELVFPRTIVAHDGRGKHFLAVPGVSSYDNVMEWLSDAQFTRIEAKSVTMKQWNELLHHRFGWELRFPTGIPVALLSERLFPDLEEINDQHWIDRIWVYEQQSELHVLFISDLENKVHGGIVDLEEAERFTRIWEEQLLPVEPVQTRFVSANPYEPARLSVSYVPAERLSLPAWEATRDVIEIEQMKELLFLDPSFVRTVSNNGDDVMMQDGSRSVRYTTSNHMLYYQNFKHTVVEKTDISSNVADAVRFINEHGGWMTDYALVTVDGTSSDEQPNRYTFRMLLHGLPVYDKNGHTRYGTVIAVERDGGHILRYERTLDYSVQHQRKSMKDIPGGPSVVEQLEKAIPLSSVRDMFPAYAVEKKKEHLVYTPDWRIQQLDGTETWLSSVIDGGK